MAEGRPTDETHGVKSQARALEVLDRARRRAAKLTDEDEDAGQLAVDEVHAHRASR